jgi:hypothetical protein
MKHKHSELIKAWADGAEIEVKHPSNSSWWDAKPPEWDLDYEYRIKPEEKKPVVRYLWAFETDVNTWEQYTLFMTEEEARKRLACKFKYVRIDWSRTEFAE